MTEPTAVANIVQMPSKKPVVQESGSRPFAPYFETCEQHGDWQVNFLDEQGAERCRPGCPECRREQRAFNALRGARIPQRYLDRTLQNYVAAHPGQITALNACKQYVRDFNDHAKSGKCLIIVGTPGAGKTHLACAVGNALLQARRTVLFCTVSELMDEFGATWKRDAQHSERDVVQAFASADLLILDDVGVQNGSNQEQITLYRVIDARYRLNKPTLVSSNLGLDETSKALGARSFDRLREGGAMLVLCNWPSYRIGNRE